MSMTPQDIQNQKFNTKFRGFDVDEVDAFLEEVAENFLALIQENKKLKAVIQAMEKNNEKFLNEEKSFKAAMVSAHRIADEMKQKGKEQADELMVKAREEVQKIHSKINTEFSKSKKEIEELKNRKTQVRNELRAILTAYLKQLDEDSQLKDDDSTAPAVLTGSKIEQTESAIEVKEDLEAEQTEPIAEENAGLDEEALAGLFEEDAQLESLEPDSTSATDQADAKATPIEPAGDVKEDLDEETLAELFQDSELTEMSDEEQGGRPAEEDDMSDLFQSVDLSETDDGQAGSASPLDELSDELLFSEEAPASGDDKPAFTYKVENNEESVND